MALAHGLVRRRADRRRANPARHAVAGALRVADRGDIRTGDARAAVVASGRCADAGRDRLRRRSGLRRDRRREAGERGRRGNPAYCTAKSALSTYLESLRNRLARYGVNVVTIKPGFVDTAMTKGKPGLFWLISPEQAATASMDLIRRGTGAQGFVLMKNAKNADQAHAWVKYIASPEGGAAYAKAFAANPAAKGAVDKSAPAFASFFKEAYPDDALTRLWWWPPQSGSVLKLRSDYAARLVAAWKEKS